MNADNPLRVWVVGDSLAGPLGNSLASGVAEHGWLTVTVEHEEGTGLVRDDTYDWPGLAVARLPQVRPEAVVCLIGANDGQALRVPGGRLEFGTPEWDDEYSARVGEFMDLLAGKARRLYWVEIPIMASAEYDTRVRHVNALHREQARHRPQVAYVVAYSLFQDAAGGFARELPDGMGGLVTVRQADGIHFTAAGAARLAEHLLSVMIEDWGLAIADAD